MKTIIGVPKAATISIVRSSAVLALTFLCMTSLGHSQILEVERSISGVPANALTLMNIGVTSTDRLDFNGDGIPERTVTASDPVKGDILKIIDGNNPERSWTMRLDGDPDHPIILGQHSLVGFFNFDGLVSNDNPKEIVFANVERGQSAYLDTMLRDVIISSYSFGAGTFETQPLGIIAILIGIVDRDRDGKDEIMLFNPDSRSTEIWGAN